MGNSSKNDSGVLNTILALAGVAAGVFLITKLTRRETKETPMSKKSTSKPKEEGVVLEPKVEGANERQQKIMEAIKEKGIITPKELQILLPEVSTRTLRRDMDTLAKAKLISQKGSTKSTFYKYIGR
jgi:predicted HTH transcriptional regulator